MVLKIYGHPPFVFIVILFDAKRYTDKRIYCTNNGCWLWNWIAAAAATKNNARMNNDQTPYILYCITYYIYEVKGIKESISSTCESLHSKDLNRPIRQKKIDVKSASQTNIRESVWQQWKVFSSRFYMRNTQIQANS